MSKVYRLCGFFIKDVLWEALIVSVSNSFKFDVWASPVDQTNHELQYRGRFTPSNEDEEALYIEVEEYVRRSLKADDLKS